MKWYTRQFVIALCLAVLALLANLAQARGAGFGGQGGTDDPAGAVVYEGNCYYQDPEDNTLHRMKVEDCAYGCA